MLNEREPAFVLASQFHLYLLWVNAFNKEKALVGAFSVITNLRMEFGCNFLKHCWTFPRVRCNQRLRRCRQWCRSQRWAADCQQWVSAGAALAPATPPATIYTRAQ